VSSPPAFTTTELSPRQIHAEALPFPTAGWYCPLRILCLRLDSVYTSKEFMSVVSPGDPYSVIFPETTVPDYRILIENLPSTNIPTLGGSACRLVRIRIGLPVADSPMLRPFSLIALLVLDPPEHTPPLLRLGAEFLHSTKARLTLSTSPCGGELRIPV
jgi:hypothetical protein